MGLWCAIGDSSRVVVLSIVGCDWPICGLHVPPWTALRVVASLFTSSLASIVRSNSVPGRLGIIAKQQLPHSLLKRNRPIVRLLWVPSPCIGMKIVNEVAAANDEDALFSQGRETFSDFIVKPRRLSFVNAQLHHRNVSRICGTIPNSPASSSASQSATVHSAPEPRTVSCAAFPPLGVHRTEQY